MSRLTIVCRAIKNATDPAPKPVDVTTWSTSRDLIPIIAEIWGIEAIDQGKIKIVSGQYKARTIQSIQDYALYTGVHKLLYVTTFHDCADFAVGLQGKFCNNPAWWGTPFGTITADLGAGWHRLNIFFGCRSIDDPQPRLCLWSPQDGQPRGQSLVTGKPLDEIAMT